MRNCLDAHLAQIDLWQGWSCWLVHCPSGNATDPIWRVLASSDGISPWTPLKPQHSNPNPNPLANQLWCIDFLTPPTPLIILTDSLPSLNLLCHSKTDARFMQNGPKEVWSILYVSVASFFPSLKQNLLHIVLLKCRHVQIAFLKFTSCDNQALVGCIPIAAVAEIIRIGQSCHKMYSNKILNFQVSTTILDYCKKMSGNLLNSPRIIKKIMIQTYLSLVYQIFIILMK